MAHRYSLFSFCPRSPKHQNWYRVHAQRKFKKNFSDWVIIQKIREPLVFTLPSSHSSVLRLHSISAPPSEKSIPCKQREKNYVLCPSTPQELKLNHYHQNLIHKPRHWPYQALVFLWLFHSFSLSLLQCLSPELRFSPVVQSFLRPRLR